ncbi:hypothetical protein AB4Z34_10320 [Ensifer sp. 2YAB10]|uniref:hypothetical protein n=1 Tax=unclassified Ensifer TaxID=2633371 RepID=UPI003F90867B
MAELPGHLGATPARKVKGNQNELVIISPWKDMASANDAVVKPCAQTFSYPSI